MTIAVHELPKTLDPASSGEDWEALRRVAAGDSDAFTGVVLRHQNRLQRLCERFLGDPEEAREVVQEVFLKAFRKAGRLRPRGQLYTWLYRVAVNHCLNVLRRRKVVRFLRLDNDDSRAPDWDVADLRADPQREVEARHEWTRMRERLERLPTSQRAVLVLARFEGLSYRKIADHLGITEGAVESRLFRAMRTMQAFREEDHRARQSATGDES